MVDKRRIILPHGQNKRLSEYTGIAEGSCSKWCRGWFDEHNESVLQSAERVRKIAVEQFGGVFVEN